MPIPLLGRPPLKGGASPRLPLTSLDTFPYSPLLFYLPLRGHTHPAPRIPIFFFIFPSFYYLHSLSPFPHCGPIKEGATSPFPFLASFISLPLPIYPLISLQRPFILPARRCARPSASKIRNILYSIDKTQLVD